MEWNHEYGESQESEKLKWEHGAVFARNSRIVNRGGKRRDTILILSPESPVARKSDTRPIPITPSCQDNF
jgi:hypothetical protein